MATTYPPGPRAPMVAARSCAAGRQLDKTDTPSPLSRTHGRHRRVCQENPRYRCSPCIFASRRAWDARNGGRPSTRGTDDDAWPRKMLRVQDGHTIRHRSQHASRPGPVRNRVLRRYRMATPRRFQGSAARAEVADLAGADGRNEPARVRSPPACQLPGNGSTMNCRSFIPGAATCPAKRGSRHGHRPCRYTER